MSQIFETQFGGRTLTIETGKLARLAGGSVTVRYGDTMVLGTANRSEPRPGLDFFPLTVDFEERMYAAGKIPGGFIKRESRPSEAAILAARLTDRPDPPALPRGLQGRRPDRPHGPLDRPGERPRHPRHDRGVGRADDQRDPVPGPDRRRARRPHRRRVRHQPDRTAQLERVRARPRRLRHPRRDHDGRGGRQASCPRTSWPRRSCSATARSQPLDRPAGAAPRGGRQDEAHAVHRARRPSRSSTSSMRPRHGREFVVFDVETTGRDAKLGRPRRDRAPSRYSDGEIADRWSTLVEPGPPDRRPPAARHHRRGRRRTRRRQPKPSQQFLDLAGDALVVGHNVGFDLGFLEAAPWRAASASSPAATSTRWSSPARPTRTSGTYKLGDLAPFFGIELEPEPSRAARRRGDRAAAALASRTTCRVASRPCKAAVARLDPRANAAPGGDADRACSTTARRDGRVSARAWPACCTRRPSASWCSTRASAWTAATSTTIRPITVEVGLLPRAHGSGAVHARRDAGADGRDARPVLGRPAHRHDQPRGPRSATSTTTTCRRTAPARTSRCVAPAGARSATARSPSGR